MGSKHETGIGLFFSVLFIILKYLVIQKVLLVYAIYKTLKKHFEEHTHKNE